MDILDHLALRYIRSYIERLNINLNGMTVLTEIGTGGFLYSSLIALEAGAKYVVAIAPDNKYATHEKLEEEVTKRINSWSLPRRRLKCIKEKADIGSEVDIILNLGHVRPINSELIDCSSERAVISYMCEKWEFRTSDVDLGCCERKKIPIAGVNEDFDSINVFKSCGQLAIKLLFDAGISVNGCKIGLFGRNNFGDVIFEALNANAATCVRFEEGSEITTQKLGEIEALVVAEYSEAKNVLEGAMFSLKQLAQINPSLKIVVFSGSIDVNEFMDHGFECFPEYAIAPLRMYKTLDYLGIRPVIALHAMGIKVGELIYRKKNQGIGYGEFQNLVQEIL